MTELSRREFLSLSAAAAAGVPFARISPAMAGDALHAQRLTTLHKTIVKGALLKQGTKGAYYKLTYGPRESHRVRDDPAPRSKAPIRWIRSFVHFTDIHLVDTQSPARVEFLDRGA